MRVSAVIFLTFLIILSSCSKKDKLARGPEVSPISATLVLADSAYALGSPVDFSMTVRNVSQDTVELFFPTACRVAFEVSRGDVKLWSSLDGKMCAQVITRNKIPPGESLSFDARWDGTSSEEGAKITYGEHFVEGVIMAGQPIRTGKVAFHLVN
ncbi:MAG TPA: hypothetical protein ENN07_03430 [candidate division Zixibacteria bacterium]|nr:hypothetical protein [candidate division Zixibacteria bacterium]